MLDRLLGLFLLVLADTERVGPRRTFIKGDAVFLNQMMTLLMRETFLRYRWSWDTLVDTFMISAWAVLFLFVQEGVLFSLSFNRSKLGGLKLQILTTWVFSCWQFETADFRHWVLLSVNCENLLLLCRLIWKYFAFTAYLKLLRMHWRLLLLVSTKQLLFRDRLFSSVGYCTAELGLTAYITATSLIIFQWNVSIRIFLIIDFKVMTRISISIFIFILSTIFSQINYSSRLFLY